MTKKGLEDRGRGLLRTPLGLSTVNVVQGNKPLTIIDGTLVA
jgi:hypothetical protein